MPAPGSVSRAPIKPRSSFRPCPCSITSSLPCDEDTWAHRSRSAGARREAASMLTVRQLSTAYGAAPALAAIDLAVHTGELVAVLGANGAGKSTLMRALSGLHRPVRGTVLLRGHDVTHWTAYHRARAGLVLVPEG